MSRGETIAIFDFDKTLTTKDSFLLFSLFAARTLHEKIVVLGLAILCKFGFLSNGSYKGLVLDHVWLDREIGEKQELLRSFQTELKSIENRTVVNMLMQHHDNGDTVVVLSASPGFYLESHVHSWTADAIVHGSSLADADGRITIDNLYGEAKARIARDLINQHAPSRVIVYTDHLSDLALIKLATDVRLVNPAPGCLRALRQSSIPFEIVFP